jgi:hypothetical protein
MKEYLAEQNVNVSQSTVDRTVSAKRVPWQHLKSTLVMYQKMSLRALCLQAVAGAAQTRTHLTLESYTQTPAFVFLATEVLRVLHAPLTHTRQPQAQQIVNLVLREQALHTCDHHQQKTA